MSAPDRPRVLTVGAYERDNFGDLLFLVVTEKYLAGAEIVAAAPFAADMTALLDREVLAFGDLLRGQDFDAIWSVGGEIGGTTAESAFRMSMPRSVFAAYTAAPYREKQRMIDEAVNGAPIVAGYLPTPGAFPRNAGATAIVNSVGLTAVRSRPVHTREMVLDGLRRADGLSVRDRGSAEYLASVDVPHTLDPDVVHSLSIIDPFERNPDADNVVVQVSDGILRKIGHENLAARLVESSALDGLRIRLLLAGLATGHDSVQAMERVAAEIERLAPARQVEIIADRRPMDLVHQIRSARVVLSSSLHVRIVSASYGIPRVTLTRTKPTRYAELWDPHMPYGIDLPDLDAAFARALEIGDRDEVIADAQELTRLADANARSLADRVFSATANRTPVERANRAAARISAYRELEGARAACAVHEGRLRTDLDDAQRDLRAARADLRAVRLELGAARAELTASRREVHEVTPTLNKNSSRVRLRRRARRLAGRVKRWVLR